MNGVAVRNRPSGTAERSSGMRIFLIAGEESGDRLGASLMAAIEALAPGPVTFSGIGGTAMTERCLHSLFPLNELAVNGFSAIPARLPLILRRIREAADAVIAAEPDLLVIIDSPDFTHRVARRVRAAAPHIPIVDYVSPTVWAWRPGRARAMRRYIDHVLALLPFEPEAYQRLRGPPCSYIGHPLIEQLGSLRPNPEEQARRDAEPPVLLVLPGSRRSEIRHHMAIFGEALGRLRTEGVAFELLLPTMPHLLEAVREDAKRWQTDWQIEPRIVVGEQEKRAAFRSATAALAKSGTVTLELALSGVPMVAAYRAGRAEAFIVLRAITVPTVILANLVIGANVVPEFVQNDCTPEKLANALRDVLVDSEMRRRQLEAFAKIDAIMSSGSASPSVRAADIVLATMRKGRQSS